MSDLSKFKFWILVLLWFHNEKLTFFQHPFAVSKNLRYKVSQSLLTSDFNSVLSHNAGKLLIECSSTFTTIFIRVLNFIIMSIYLCLRFSLQLYKMRNLVIKICTWYTFIFKLKIFSLCVCVCVCVDMYMCAVCRHLCFIQVHMSKCGHGDQRTILWCQFSRLILIWGIQSK